MAAHPLPKRVALVVHPTRPVDGALATLSRWAGAHDVEVVQLAVNGNRRRHAAAGTLQDGDVVVAVGGDGTVLAALRAAAAKSAPVLGVACGSLGALTRRRGRAAHRGARPRLRGRLDRASLPALAIGGRRARPTTGPNDSGRGPPRRRPGRRRRVRRRRALRAPSRRRAGGGHRARARAPTPWRPAGRCWRPAPPPRVHAAGHARRQRRAARGPADELDRGGPPELLRLSDRDRRPGARGRGTDLPPHAASRQAHAAVELRPRVGPRPRPACANAS